MKFDNQMTLTIDAKTKNESFARTCVAAFCIEANPSLSELNDVKTAVSEAVTNSIVHGYEGNENGKITIAAGICGKELYVSILDNGKGIENIEEAKKPFFTSKPEQERSGMGFTVMETFMDTLLVKPNEEGGGLVVQMKKKFGGD